VTNLVRNGIKFSAPRTSVILRAEEAEGRVVIDVEDSCGGLPPGKVEELFTPLVQRGTDRTGFGLGLAIALQAAEAHHGTIRVRDLPGKGCVFTVDLPAMSRS
jgi:signal transduction histidine kinase